MYRPIFPLLFILVASNFIDAQDTAADIANGHTTTVGVMAFNDDGSRLASLDYSGTLLVWDIKTLFGIREAKNMG
jgi:WD40 repeat protein